MKILTWKEFCSLKGDVVWAWYEEGGFPEKVWIQYDCKRECSGFSSVVEEFPLLLPEYPDCHDYFSTFDKFRETSSGEVSECSTFRHDCYHEPIEPQIVVYDCSDIDRWVNKLYSLNIEY